MQQGQCMTSSGADVYQDMTIYECENDLKAWTRQCRPRAKVRI